METILIRLFVENWPRKLVALAAALVIWMFVNNSIIDTKMLPNVRIRIVNLPADKTVIGMMPNGFLSKRVNLTLSGTKDIIDEIEPGDLEVALDASTADQNEWVVNITKKNLVSLNPDIDLAQHITQVEHSEFVIKLSRLITAKVPINILQPTGEPPPGYEYLDFWPQRLNQTVSGPEEEIQKLKAKGLDVTFDLNDITREELESIKSSQGNFHDDEIRYLIPNKWKTVSIPFQNNLAESINDPESQSLRIYFLRKQTLPIDQYLPLALYFPMSTSDKLNPDSCKIIPGKFVEFKNNIPLFTIPLYVKDVSRLFLSIIRDNLQIALIAAPHKEREFLEWSLEVINASEMEDTYLAFLVNNLTGGKSGALPKRREMLIRERFRKYLQRLKLYTAPDQKLNIESVLENGKVSIASY